MIAMLALTRGGRRSRVWLQDALWGRCEKNEAQNNLRRELSSLRLLLAPAFPDILDIDRETVGLRLDLCEVDALRQPADAGELLEGFDIAGEEGFEEWLRAERAARDSGRRDGPGGARPGMPAAVAAIAPAAREPAVPHADDRLVVRLTAEAWHNGATDAMVLPDLLQQAVIACIEETGCFRITVGSDGTSAVPDLDVWMKTTAASDALAVTVLCTRVASRTVLVSMQSLFGLDASLLSLSREVRDFAAQFVERLLHRSILSAEFDDGVHAARKRLVAAIGEMFSLNQHSAAVSRTALVEAKSLDRQGLFHAWRAYQAVFVHDPAHAYDCRLTLEECREDMRIALELDPYSGVSLALCAHVEAFLFRDFAAAAEHLERARATGTQHVMYYDAQAMHRFYCGDLVGARAMAVQAGYLGRNLPFRYCFATSMCMIEAMTGNLEAAAAHGRRALSLEPEQRTISYPPTLRYLGAVLAHMGRRDDAAEVFDRLEPGHRERVWRSVRDHCLPNRDSADFVRAGFAIAGR